jgi:Zn-dependent protease
VIGVVGIYQGSDLATEVAVMMLILNALNLLPLLPLDGGWVVAGWLMACSFRATMAWMSCFA